MGDIQPEYEASESKTVLVVDDISENLQLLSAILTSHGYDVKAARNGEGALQYLERNNPDAILLDIKMPDPDGFEVCRRLKAKKQTQNIPVIFISALDGSRDKSAAYKAGGVDYITKPFLVEEVLARVNTHVTLRKLQIKLQQAYN